MRLKRYIGILVVLLALAAVCSAATVGTVPLVRIVNVTTTATTQSICTAPCECMAAGSAEAKWGANGYTQCSQTPCGRAPTATAVIPYYCFRPVTTTTTPSDLTCPGPCQCANLETARSAGWTTYCGGKQQSCGYDKLKNPLFCWEPYVTCRDGCTCLSRDDGAAKKLSLCDGKLADCGRTDAGLPKYCYENPTPVTRVTTVATTTSPTTGPYQMVTGVALVPVTPQVIISAGIAPYCQLSGELMNFDHDPGLLEVRLQEAVYMQKSCLPNPPYTCIGPLVMTKQDSEPSSASVSQVGSDLIYKSFVRCNESFHISVVEPVQLGECDWKGTWTPSKSNYVVMNGSAKSGYDFTFVPENEVEDTACTLCNDPGLPASFDWRNVAGHNWLTPVRDQAGCGSCWAMATLGVTEAMYNIENDDAMNLNLAEQNLISCTGGGGNCAGGWPFNAATYIRNTGVVTETCFPYVAWNAPCTYACASPASNRWKIAEHTPLSLAEHIPRDTNGWKRALLCKGPLAVCDHSHCVTLVGWNDATQKWTFKNSWGEDYGTNGYGTRLYTDDTWMLYAWWFGGVYQ